MKLESDQEKIKEMENENIKIEKQNKLKRRLEQLEIWRKKKLKKKEEEDRNNKEEEKAKKELKEDIFSKGLIENEDKNETTEKNENKLKQEINKEDEELDKSKKQIDQKQKKEETSSKREIEKSINLKKLIEFKKRRIFKGPKNLFEEEHNTEIKFKKPDLENQEDGSSANSEEDCEEDLERYLRKLEKDNQDREPKYNIVSETNNDNSEHDYFYSESDNLDEEEEEQQKLLSSKFMKLHNKEKILNQVDHSAIDYPDFRKLFFKEPLEMQKLTEKEVKKVRYLLDDIKISGDGCPKPILKWSQLGLPDSMMNLLENKLKYQKPSPIQCQALPSIMSGRDVIAVAKTGSGKTISFILPMIRHVIDQPRVRNNDGPIAMILTPTRELALQIDNEIVIFSQKLDISVCCCYGGSSLESQISELKKGVEIVVCTPGRFIDLLATNNGRIINLRKVTFVVLDEADRMFDMGFEPQINNILMQIRPDRQTVLLSATFPKKIEYLAKKILNNPIKIVVGGISIVAPEVTQKIKLFECKHNTETFDQLRFEELTRILDEHGTKDSTSKILIFVEKQSFCDNLLVLLLAKNYVCLTIHGGKSQTDRKHSIKQFSSPNSNVNILIATSIAARGIDVKNLNLVINYDAPNHLEDYVHRVGRTGRGGMKGVAITFVAESQERSISDIVKAFKLSKMPLDQISPKLLELNNSFIKKVKEDKENFGFGFGGKGLDNLQEIRDNLKNIQKKSYTIEIDSDKILNTQNDISQDFLPLLSDFQIIDGSAPETSGPDKCKFHTRIVINDLPQKTRWLIVNRNNLSKIIEATSTSITSKGQYYPLNSKNLKKSSKDPLVPPKLYLLVEGLTKSSVRHANNLIRQKMIESLDVAVKDDNKNTFGKYSI